MACVKQDPNMVLSLPRRILIFILGFLDNFLLGGAIFGWPQLVYVLKVEGVFAGLCLDPEDSPDTWEAGARNQTSPAKTFMGMDFGNSSCGSTGEDSVLIAVDAPSQAPVSSCPAQDERFALIYTVAVVCYGVPGIVVGFILHYVGLRVTRLIGGLMVTASFLCLALTSYESPDWLFPATILLAIGGNQLRMCSMQLGDLFPRHRSTAITILTGVYAASASLFLLYWLAQENGVHINIVSWSLAAFVFVSTLLSIVMPSHHVPYERHHETSKAKHKRNDGAGIPLWESFTTLSSWLHMYWFFITIFVINVYQLFYNVWITASTCSPKEASFYSTIFSYSNLVSVFVAPVGGVFTDYLVRKAEKGEDSLTFSVHEIQASFLPLLLTTLFAMVMHTCLLFFAPTAIIISLICMIVVRPCTVAISTAYLRIRFPAGHFNRLLGIYCTVISPLMFFQFPLFQWAQHMYYAAQGVILVLITLSLSNPLHLLFTKQMKRVVIERDRLIHTFEEVERL